MAAPGGATLPRVDGSDGAQTQPLPLPIIPRYFVPFPAPFSCSVSMLTKRE
jgi:hypothetical protein